MKKLDIVKALFKVGEINNQQTMIKQTAYHIGEALTVLLIFGAVIGFLVIFH